MCMNAAGDGHRELQVLTAGLMQSGGQSGMRTAAFHPGMQCRGQVSGTQAARQAALAQPSESDPTPKKIFRPLLCVGNYALHKL